MITAGSVLVIMLRNTRTSGSGFCRIRNMRTAGSGPPILLYMRTAGSFSYFWIREPPVSYSEEDEDQTTAGFIGF